MKRGTSKVEVLQHNPNINIGYIIVPFGVDRTKFVEQCYRWERVSICVERGGGGIHECYITKEAIKEVEFPESSDKLGSCVAFFTDPFSNLPIITSVLSKEDESQLLGEGMFKTIKSINGSIVTVSGDAKKGVINISVEGGSISQLNISAANANKNAKINIRCQGDIKIETTGTLKINKGSEAMIKGNELNTQLDTSNELLQALIDIIKGGPINEPGNGAPSALQLALSNAIATKSLGDYSNIKSTESFLD
jgi:hypothetical protein